MKTMLEVREYNFEGGTTLTIELDRRNKTASFVEYDAQQKRYKPTTFKFAGREVKYMNGWRNILSAMQYVIKDVTPIMESWAKEEMDKLIDIMLYLAEEDAKRNEKPKA